MKSSIARCPVPFSTTVVMAAERARRQRLRPLMVLASRRGKGTGGWFVAIVRNWPKRLERNDLQVLRGQVGNMPRLEEADTYPWWNFALQMPLGAELMRRLAEPARSQAFRRDAVLLVIELLAEWRKQRDGTGVHPNAHAHPSRRRLLRVE